MLSLLTDDIERQEAGEQGAWHGKKEFDRNIRPSAAVQEMRGEISRMTEEGNVVVAEGLVRLSMKDGNALKVQFCDVFEFEGHRVRRLTAFTALVK